MFVKTITFFYYKSISSIEYALNKIAYSYVTHDTSTFYHYVDVRSLVGNYLKSNPTDETNIFEIIHENTLYDKVEDSYVDELESWVEFGYYNNPVTSVLLQNKDFVDSISTNHSKLVNLESPQISGDSGIVKMNFYQPRYDTTLSLIFHFRDMGHYWRLYKISNLQESLEKLKSLETKLTTKTLNKSRIQFLDAIQISELSSNKDGDLFFSIKNISEKSIDSLSFTIHYYNKNDSELSRFNTIENFIREVSDIEDSKIISMYINESYLNLKPTDSMVFSTKTGDKSKYDEFYLDEMFVRFKDGSKIEGLRHYHPIFIYGFKHYLLTHNLPN